MRAHAPVGARDRSGDTPLHDAARNGHLQVVQALVEAGALIDVCNYEGKTAVDVARQFGRVLVVEVCSLHKSLAKIDG